MISVKLASKGVAPRRIGRPAFRIKISAPSGWLFIMSFDPHDGNEAKMNRIKKLIFMKFTTPTDLYYLIEVFS